MDLLLEHSG